MRRLIPALAVAAVARMAFHAVFLPAFAGADEPQHLARIRDFAGGPLREAFAGRSVDAAVLEEQGLYPCDASVRAAAGCPAYGQVAGAFDLLRPAPAGAPRGARAIPNVEANQPPLFYLAAGLLLRPFPLRPAAQLLAARLLAVALVAAALFGPLRRLVRGWPPAVAVAGLLALLVPGASEALARCSNDAAVFLWASLVLAALARRTGPAALVLLLAAGPLLKLTAIPVVVFAVAVLARERSPALAATAGAASLAILPVQALRGWMWGGTLELNARAAASPAEPIASAAAGFLRSAYAFVKTALWSGGQSLRRPPRWLVAAYGAWLAAAAAILRLRPLARRPLAHGAAAAACAAGFAVFALANRRLYGVWGGVGGWYLWSWSPWIAEAASDLAIAPRRAARVLLGLEAALVVAANAAWFADAVRFYGV